MSNMSKAVKGQNKKSNAVTNYMGGTSYKLGAMDTLKMVTASSIFGEPQYYRDGEFEKSGVSKIRDGLFSVDYLFKDYSVLPEKFEDKRTSEIMESVIDDALSVDFEGVLDWAVILREQYYMRLNPQVIMVRAAMHPNRVAYTEKNPNGFSEHNNRVMSRADDVISQLTYYLYKNGSKNKVPGVLRRSWAKRIEGMTRYEMAKYANAGIGLVDTVRVCHAHSADVDELMKTGTVSVPDSMVKWETLRATGKSWVEILDTIKMPHMALLRNLRGIFTEVDDTELCKKLIAQLVAGVEKGKQFPFRYMSASNAVEHSEANHKAMLIDGLEECADAACANLPTLSGKSAFLTDNSGSAWGSFNSEYGSVTVAEINNLSSVIGAANSEDGYVMPFGDRLLNYPISKRRGVLHQAKEISVNAERKVGGGTENGVWIFFKNAIEKKEKWDNIFIYSDMQAGHGGLYGTDESKREYRELGFNCNYGYMDVAKMVDTYRKKVNSKVNVFMVQTAGYDNVLVPESGYRTSILYGWTGKELVYADFINRFWDEKDEEKQNKQKN